MRDAMVLVLQALIDLEADAVIGAGRYERSDTRTTHRNGSRSRLLSTKAGNVELAIPKLRQGSFYPALLKPRRRIDRALGRHTPAEVFAAKLKAHPREPVPDPTSACAMTASTRPAA